MKETITKQLQEQVRLNGEGDPLRIVQETKITLLTNYICTKQNLH